MDVSLCQRSHAGEESSTSPIRIRRSPTWLFFCWGLRRFGLQGPSFLNVRGSMNTNAGLASSQRPDAHGRYTSAPPIGFTRLASWTRKSPGRSRLLDCWSRNLEVVMLRANRRHGDNHPAIRLEVVHTEAWSLHNKTTVLHADIPAGTELIGQTVAKQSADTGARFGIKVGCAVVLGMG